MTDAEVDANYTVLAVMLAAPYLNGDHGELPASVRDDIQATLWTYGYGPAQQILIAEGATPEQVVRATHSKKTMFRIAEAEDRDVSR